MDEIAYFEQRCRDHQKLACEAKSALVLRAHLAFVRVYRIRIAELLLRDKSHPESAFVRNAA